MKRIPLFVFVTLLLSSQVFAGGWNKSLESAQKAAKAKNQLIFIDMFADWCGWCHRMEQEVFPSEAFQKATDNMVLLRLNTEDGGDGTRLARSLGVATLPTFVVITPDVGIAGIIRGYSPANEFSKSVEQVETQYAAFLQRIKDEPKIAKDYQKRLDLAIELAGRRQFLKSEARFRRLLAEPKVPTLIRDRAYYELSAAQVADNRLDEASSTIRKFVSVSSIGEQVERARLLQGEIFLKKGNLMAAMNELRAFKKDFPKSELNRNVDMILPQLEAQLKTR